MPAPISRRSFLGTSMGVLASLALVACGASDPATSQDAASDGQPEEASTEADSATTDGLLTKPLDNGFDSGLHHATIEVEGLGTMQLELNATNTPITVSNFAQLAMEGFYDGLTFHRVKEGVMIQGGDPNGNGTGGAPRKIKGEFYQNGITNAIQHKRGVISMARGNDLDSASSQFFIMQQDDEGMDGRYAAFGRVTDGIEVVDAIVEQTPVQDSNGTVAGEDQPRITSIRMVD
jgi:peptidyl-prolyl cis-trans isomerase B (cyclophilin B)